MKTREASVSTRVLSAASEGCAFAPLTFLMRFFAAVFRPERIGSASSSVSGAEISYAGGRVTSIDSRVAPRRSKPSAGWMMALRSEMKSLMTSR